MERQRRLRRNVATRYRIIPGPIIPGIPFIIGAQEAAIVVDMKIHGRATRTAKKAMAMRRAFAQLGHDCSLAT